MRFFKSLFAKKQPETRTLSRAQDLQLNDIFTFSDSFALPQAMRKQQLQVIEINTLEFKHQHYAQITGEGSGQQLVYLSFPENPKKLLKFSLLLTRNEVQSLFDLDAFSEIFEAPGCARLTPHSKQPPYADMLADAYIQQDFMTAGYTHQQDYRGQRPPQYSDENSGREFEFYSLSGGDGERSIDIYIFENGDTDIYLSFLRPASEITELWVKGE